MTTARKNQGRLQPGEGGALPYKVLNMRREDILNMLIGGVKPTQHDVVMGLARFTGTPSDPKVEWNRKAFDKISVAFILKMYRKRADRKSVV